jgi:hypothetical protein
MEPYEMVGTDPDNPETHVVIDVTVPGKDPRKVSVIPGTEQVSADEIAANS